MKKVINITIGTIVFSIEDDAYEKLSNYIASIRNHFGTNEEGNEIVEDIERGIAEKFQARVKESRPISLESVEEVIAEMGSIHDFEDFDGKTNTEENSGVKIGIKRLYRDVDNSVIAGVSSGIATFFGIDPVIVRIIFVILAFINGLGILAYIILWLIMPKATTTTQKLEMHGEVVTLKKISEFVEENIEKVKKKDTPPKTKKADKVKVYGAVIDFNKSLLGGIGSAIRIILGIIFTLIGLIGMVALTIGAFAILVVLPTSHIGPEAQIILETFIGENSNPSIIIAAYFLIFIPFFSLFLSGIGMIRRKAIFNAPLIVLLTIAWFYALMSLLVFGSNNVHILQERIESLHQPPTMIEEIEGDLLELDLLLDEVYPKEIETENLPN